MQLIFPLLLLLIFVVPIGLLIWFVMARAKKRRLARVAPWTALAQKWGGTFADDVVRCPRGTHELRLDVALVSVMQATGGPYYPDGGTFTCARLLTHTPIAQTAQPARVSADELKTFVPNVGELATDMRVILEPQGAVIVMPGSVIDDATIEKAFFALDQLQQVAAANGPMAITK